MITVCYSSFFLMDGRDGQKIQVFPAAGFLVPPVSHQVVRISTKIGASRVDEASTAEVRELSLCWVSR